MSPAAKANMAAFQSELGRMQKAVSALAQEVGALQRQVSETRAACSERGGALAEEAGMLQRQISDTGAALSEQVRLVGANILGLGSRQEDGFRGLRRALSASGGPGMAADLYLDLLEQVLTGTLYSDAADSPFGRTPQDPLRRAVGYDWPATAETMIGVARLRNLRRLLTCALEEGVPGDFIETGVWRGGACIYARAVLAAYGDATRRVFVADSFRGLPPPDPDAFPADAGDPHYTFSQLSISRAEVEANFRRYGLLDDQVIFLEGWFKDTLPAAPIDRLAVLRLDGDMYESTIQALEALYHKISPGGFVIVDDYILKACAQAVDEFRGRHGITAEMQDVDGAAVWWRVEG
jgi:hypothetical protein